MRVAFVGKGGSGKTTMSALFARYLASQGGPVVIVDADINQHLALVLGVEDPPEPLGSRLTEIKELLRGDNPRIPSAQAMVKTTPPGRGSRLLTFKDLATSEFAITTPEGLRLMATGPFSEDDLGVACYHSKTGAVEPDFESRAVACGAGWPGVRLSSCRVRLSGRPADGDHSESLGQQGDRARRGHLGRGSFWPVAEGVLGEVVPVAGPVRHGG
jgi:CobQ/CobB/MinD/ParA nucleotide binding domain